MKRLILFLLVLTLAGAQVRASHTAACDLTYQALGGNDYLITLSFYRDCSGISEPTTATVNLISSCDTFSFVLNKIPPIQGEEIDMHCSSVATYCTGGVLFGVRKFVYQGVVTLIPCSHWLISYSLCCRTPSNTIVSPTSASLYIPATINNLNGMNSSPVFNQDPVVLIGSGHLNCLDFSGTDPDGDSLVYSLVTPWDLGPGGASPSVTYLAGYSAQQPIPSSPQVYLDSDNGILYLTPTVNLTTVLAVQIDEYRTIGGVPVKVGSVLRDIQLYSQPSSNIPPELSGINPLATQFNPADTIFSVTACQGTLVYFDIFSNDPDIPDDSLTITWDNAISGAYWYVTNNGGADPVASFKWIADTASDGSSMRCFWVKVIDDNCPYNEFRTFQYCIRVFSNTLSFAMPPDTLCADDPPLKLYHGDPVGGTYFGNAVDQGYFYPDLADPGFNAVYYTYAAGDCSDTVAAVLWVDPCLGIDNQNMGPPFSVYPNPFSGMLNVEIPGTGEYIIRVQDVAGRELYNTKLNRPAEQHPLDLSFLNDGVYMIVLEGPAGKSTSRVVKVQ